MIKYLLALGTGKVLKAVAHYFPLKDVNEHGFNVLTMRVND